MSKREQMIACVSDGKRVCDLDLRGVDCHGTNLSCLLADKVDLCCAILNDSSLRHARLGQCKLTAANLVNADLSAATLRLCSLDNAHLESARFDSARLEDSSAVAADFSRASFRGAHLTETSFSRAVLREAVLEEAEGAAIDFRGADLRSASLKNVRFDEGDFRGADLRGADLSRGRFHSADFRGALLDDTCFDGADYTGATFDDGEAPPGLAAVCGERPFAPPADATTTRSTAMRNPADSMPGASAAQGDLALKTLNEFLALLPHAISGAQPEETMQRLQQLIDKTAASAEYSSEQQKALHDLFSDLTKPGGFDTRWFQQLLASVNSGGDEPPEELKVWLEPFMRAERQHRKE